MSRRNRNRTNVNSSTTPVMEPPIDTPIDPESTEEEVLESVLKALNDPGDETDPEDDEESTEDEPASAVGPMNLVIERPENKSELIRRLHFESGLDAKTIAKNTNIRYQMVRNVIVAENTKRELAAARSTANR